MAKKLGSYLIRNQLYFEGLGGRKLIGIYSKNRYEWAVTDIACQLYGLTKVPLYDTFGMESMEYCLEHSEMKTCFVTKETIKKFDKMKKFGNLKNLISFD